MFNELTNGRPWTNEQTDVCAYEVICKGCTISLLNCFKYLEGLFKKAHNKIQIHQEIWKNCCDKLGLVFNFYSDDAPSRISKTIVQQISVRDG